MQRSPLTIPESDDGLEDLHLLAGELLVLCEVHELGEDGVLLGVGAVVPVGGEHGCAQVEARGALVLGDVGREEVVQELVGRGLGRLGLLLLGEGGLLLEVELLLTAE